MLVISRKHGESIRIGDETTVTILQVKGRRVRLGVEAPESQRILRSELCSDECEPELQTADDVEPAML